MNKRKILATQDEGKTKVPYLKILKKVKFNSIQFENYIFKLFIILFF